MAVVITITITESSEQVLHGIPKYVELGTNMPSTIFYTLDGTDPSVTSNVYLGGQLELPTNQTTVILKVFATDGTDTSPIIPREYKPDIVGIRRSHDKVDANYACGCEGQNMFPYGDQSPEPPGIYDNIGGDITDRPDVPNVSSGFDGTGTGTSAGGTDRPLDTYQLRFSEFNETGERGHGIGTLPSEVTIKKQDPPPPISDANSPFFDPRALVIYQDNTQEPHDPDVSQINRQFFSLENAEKVKDGTLLNTTSIEGLAPTGSFVRSHFNPRDNTITYYYFDSQTLRWIISKEPYTPTSETARKGLARVVFTSRDSGAQYVYKWRQFAGRRLI